MRSNALFNNEWHQIICTRDRDDKKICIFIDGEQKTEIDDECGDLSISKISIGNRDEESGFLPFRGMMDELRISTGAMNARQVSEYYQDPSAGIAETAPMKAA